MTMKTQLKTWDAVKAVQRGKFIAIQSYFRKQTNKKTSNRQPNFTHKKTEKGTKKPQVSRIQ